LCSFSHDFSLPPSLLLYFQPLSLSLSMNKPPSCYCLLVMQPPRFKLVRIKPIYYESQQTISFSKLYNSSFKIKISRPPFQANISNHSNVFTFTLFYSERLTGEAWEPAYKTMVSVSQ
jgi:hypothetical protein